MLRICKEDGTVPTAEAEAIKLVEEEIEALDSFMQRHGDDPMTNFEKSCVRTYIMGKLNFQIPNPVEGAEE